MTSYFRYDRTQLACHVYLQRDFAMKDTPFGRNTLLLFFSVHTPRLSSDSCTCRSNVCTVSERKLVTLYSKAFPDQYLNQVIAGGNQSVSPVLGNKALPLPKPSSQTPAYHHDLSNPPLQHLHPPNPQSRDWRVRRQ